MAMRALSDERGGITGFVILAPVLLFMILGVVQMAIVGHVRHLAELAATAGVTQASAHDGSAAFGQLRAETQMAKASGWVVDSQVSVTRGGNEASVVVTASAFVVLPFGDWSVDVRRTSPIERPQS